MDKIITISAVALLVVNVLFGAILSCYGGFNVAVSSVVIVITAATLWAINHMTLKDAFKVSLTLLFALAGAIEFLVSLFMPSRFTDNWGLIAVILFLLAQGLMLLVCNVVSNKVK